ncbi:MAG: hypothetical protein Q9190_002868 [Brigantiaea leucoxantha]
MGNKEKSRISQLKTQVQWLKAVDKASNNGKLGKRDVVARWIADSGCDGVSQLQVKENCATLDEFSDSPENSLDLRSSNFQIHFHDVTSKFRAAAAVDVIDNNKIIALHTSQLLKDPLFTLFDAVGALEVHLSI